MAFLLFVAFVLKHSIEKHFDISLLEHMSMNNLHVLVHQFYKYQLNPFDFSLIKNSISDRTKLKLSLIIMKKRDKPPFGPI